MGCNQPMSEVHSSLQKVFEKEGKTKIEKCNHPTPEAYNSWQKVLKKEGRDEIDKCNHMAKHLVLPRLLARLLRMS